MIAITDYNLIMETFQKDGDSFAGRPTPESLMNLSVGKECEKIGSVCLGGNYGVVFTDGEIWRDQRRLALHVFRNFGMGKNLMQEKVAHTLIPTPDIYGFLSFKYTESTFLNLGTFKFRISCSF